MRKNGFDRLETIIADGHEETLRGRHAGFDPEQFYSELYSP